ncbi:Kelch-like protein 23, partial [Lamellibrachia satsuma]
WEEMPPLITARYHHRSVSLGNCVYVVGGKGLNKKILSSVECLNAKRQQWFSVPSMPQAVRSPMVVTHINDILVFGGRDGRGEDLCCAQVFDTTRSHWSTLSDMPGVCSFGAAVTLNDLIYVVGGDNRTCIRYDPSMDSWTRLSQPHQAHRHAPAVVWHGNILVAEG